MDKNCLVYDEWWKAGMRESFVDRVTEALELGSNVNSSDENGGTPLHFAAAYQADSEVISILLRYGGDIHAETRSKQQPIHWAAGKNATMEVMSVLIRAGANINATDINCRTPLHLAINANAPFNFIEFPN